MIRKKTESYGLSRLSVLPPWFFKQKEGEKIMMLPGLSGWLTEIEKKYVNFVYSFTGQPTGVGYDYFARQKGGTWEYREVGKYYRIYIFPLLANYLFVYMPFLPDLLAGRAGYRVGYGGEINSEILREIWKLLRELVIESRKTDKYGYEKFPINKKFRVDADIFLQEPELFANTWENNVAGEFRLFAFPVKEKIDGWNMKIWVNFASQPKQAYLEWQHHSFNNKNYKQEFICRLYSDKKEVKRIQTSFKKPPYLSEAEKIVKNFYTETRGENEEKLFLKLLAGWADLL